MNENVYENNIRFRTLKPKALDPGAAFSYISNAILLHYIRLENLTLDQYVFVSAMQQLFENFACNTKRKEKEKKTFLTFLFLILPSLLGI